MIAVSFTAYNYFNIASLAYISVNTASFLFSLTVVIVPILQTLAGKHEPLSVWIGVVLIIGGIWFASGAVFAGNDTATGGLLSFSGAFIRAFFMIGVAWIARRMDTCQMLVELIFFTAVLSLPIWLLRDPQSFWHPVFPMEFLIPLLCFALLSIVLSTSIATLVQRYTTATETSVIFSTQLVFTLIFMALMPETFLPPEPLTIVNAAGCLLIVSGSILATCDLAFLPQRLRQ